MPSLDIVIPVFDRLATLEEALKTIVTQHIPFGWRVSLTIVDDGNAGDTEAVVARIPIPTEAWQRIHIIHLPRSGTATARQAGIKSGQGEVVLLLGADILLRPGVLAEHMAFHDRHPHPTDAALGLVTWDPYLRPTPLMEWMIHGGPQNDIDQLLGEITTDPTRYFYASHVSLKRSLVSNTEVRPQYCGYGWEDIDLGCQLGAKGMVLYVLHSAIGLHHHQYKVDDIARRQRSVGQNYPVFVQLNPQPQALSLTTARKVKIVILYLSGLGYLLKAVTQASATRRSLPTLFAWLTSYEFWRGMWGKERQEKVA